MAKHRVQLFNQSRGVEVDTEATPGATVGVDLRLEDGTVVTYDMLFRQPPSDSGDPGAVYWRTIMEVPPNVTALQNTETAGLYVLTGPGGSATRTLTTNTLSLQNASGVDGDPVVDLGELEDAGTGALLAVERDQYGRVAGTKPATITGAEGEVTVEHGDAVGGLPTVGLADVPDEGGGALQRFQRDGKGRVSGTSEATTDDLPEGSNLYFTDERADARVDAGIAEHVAQPDPHPQYTTASEAAAAAPVQSVNGKQGTVVLGAADVGAVSKSGAAVIQAADPFLLTLESYSDANAVVFEFRKSRGESIGAPGLVLPGDQLLGLRSAGSNGAGGWLDGGRLSIVATGSPAQNRFPTEFRFETVNQSGTMRTRWTIEDAGHFNVWADNAYDIGSGATRPRQMYAATGTINTSDAREKTEPRDLTEAELAAAADIARLPCIFQWLHAIEEKGEDARLHSSPTVQAVIAAMEAHGLDPFRYGFVCFDQWDEQPEIRDEETGEVTQEYRPAGDRYSLRPTELAHFVLRGLAHRQDELERRLVALER